MLYSYAFTWSVSLSRSFYTLKFLIIHLVHGIAIQQWPPLHSYTLACFNIVTYMRIQPCTHQ